VRRAFILAFILLLTCSVAFASLSPNDVVVVYNASTSADGCDWSASKAVADYYCSARDIPPANELGVVWPRPYETIIPADLVHYVVNDQYDGEGNLLYKGLKTQLAERAGLSAGQTPDLATDPTKCIVLCYGIPIKVSEWYYCRCSSVDSALTLLFQQTPWGRLPIGAYPWDGSCVVNPYYDAHWDPAERSIPADFGAFRSSSANQSSEAAPPFTVVRMLSATHAIAAGKYGLLYSGRWVETPTPPHWEWSAVKDPNKHFILGHITDVCVLSSTTAYLATDMSDVLRSQDSGVTWQQIRKPVVQWRYSPMDT
jgi:hypothetical protein